MKYNHWTKIDDGAEGAWAADVWLKTLKIIKRHEGEEVYNANSLIYEELEKEVPELSWRTYEGDSFRPYFRDFSKPWVLTKVATFDGFFTVTNLGVKLLSSEVSEVDFWLNFLSTYTEGEEYPFVEISNAFLKLSDAVSLEDIYWGIVRNYRGINEHSPDLSDIPDVNIPSTAKRRLLLMLHIMERAGGILRIGNGSKQRWKKWDEKVLNKITKNKIKNVEKSVFTANSTLINKPFILLAGISGTGKTRFVREQAKASGSIEETYCLVSVRPDWHEPSDLLGYVSRLGERPQYIATDVLRFIVQAWKEIIASIEYDADGVASDWRGHSLDKIKPFWLCLDEMNLAPVEQYFSDYLSVLETRCWYSQEQLGEYNSENGTDLEYLYHCDSLLKSDVIKSLDNSDKDEKKSSNELASALGLDLSESLDSNIWQYFYHNGIAIPFNLIVAGTVNMDETTHGFSRKVIDRALSFDFGDFFPNKFDQFITPENKPKTLSYPTWSDARQHLSDLPSVDSDGAKSIEFLKSVNGILKNTPFELAFRALNELLLAVISTKPQDDLELHAVWDDFLMCKVLPRIEGDSDKLGSDPSLLEGLTALLRTQFADFWDKQDGEADARPDLYQEKITKDDDKVVRIACRSKAKLEWMQERLVKSTFTSFWP